MNVKKNKGLNKKKSRKKGGNRARSKTLCKYSPNMDNGSNGVYGFHPVWWSSCCNNQNFQKQNIDTIRKIGVIGGKPLTNTKGGKRNKKSIRKRFQKIQKGGQTNDIEELEKNIESLKQIIQKECSGSDENKETQSPKKIKGFDEKEKKLDALEEGDGKGSTALVIRNK